MASGLIISVTLSVVERLAAFRGDQDEPADLGSDAVDCAAVDLGSGKFEVGGERLKILAVAGAAPGLDDFFVVVEHLGNPLRDRPQPFGCIPKIARLIEMSTRKRYHS
jgi:hypothetical protein